MRKRERILLGAWDIVSLLAALWALSENALTMLGRGFEVDIPIVKWIFVVFQSINGQRVNTLVMALGLGSVFWSVRDRRRQRHPWVSVAGLFLAVCTVFGKSYMETDSWDYIFYGRSQFCLACFVAWGYYITYRNCILFVGQTVEKIPQAFRREIQGKWERWLFESHPLMGSLVIMWILEIPWLICFSRGQWNRMRIFNC